MRSAIVSPLRSTQSVKKFLVYSTLLEELKDEYKEEEYRCRTGVAIGYKSQTLGATDFWI